MNPTFADERAWVKELHPNSDGSIGQVTQDKGQWDGYRDGYGDGYRVKE